MSLDCFIKVISNNNILPLKYLSKDIVDKLNKNLTYQMIENEIKVINMLKRNPAWKDDTEDWFLGEKSKCVHSINNVIVDVFYKI